MEYVTLLNEHLLRVMAEHYAAQRVPAQEADRKIMRRIYAWPVLVATVTVVRPESVRC